MRIIFLGVFFFFTLVLNNCGSEKRVEVAQKQLPMWYMNPPQSTPSTLYAVGEGKSKKEAIDGALSLLASTLSVSISSSFNAKTVVKEGRVNSSDATYINQTQSDVKKVRITNYELLNAEQLGFKRYAVLIKADKKALFDGLKNDIDQRLEIISKEEKSVQNENGLEQYSFYKKSLNEVADIPNSLSVMKVLNTTFNSSEYLQKLAKLKQSYTMTKAQITFSIITQENTKRFSSSIEKGLTNEGFKIEVNTNKYHFRVFVRAKINRASAYGFDIARSEISFVTKDYKNRAVATNVVHIDGQSSQGYKIALQDIVKKLNLMVEKEGIAEFLKLNI